TQQNLATIDSGAAVENALISQRAVPQKSKLGASVEHVGSLGSANEINPVVGDYRRGIDTVGVGAQLFLVDHFACAGLNAINHASTFAGPIKMAQVIDGRRDIRAFVDSPEHMAPGNVPFASSPNSHGGIFPRPDRENHTVMRDEAGTDVILNAV